jgi:hypothetical protein
MWSLPTWIGDYADTKLHQMQEHTAGISKAACWRPTQRLGQMFPDRAQPGAAIHAVERAQGRRIADKQLDGVGLVG